MPFIGGGGGILSVPLPGPFPPVGGGPGFLAPFAPISPFAGLGGFPVRAHRPRRHYSWLNSHQHLNSHPSHKNTYRHNSRPNPRDSRWRRLCSPYPIAEASHSLSSWDIQPGTGLTGHNGYLFIGRRERPGSAWIPGADSDDATPSALTILDIPAPSQQTRTLPPRSLMCEISYCHYDACCV